ncbi:MAG: hypothetical protein E7Z90_06145 [Cyanobacteria bacterium SIG29]|nr:hypothetical protein [Cyanobacteria bacterium SIG29]
MKKCYKILIGSFITVTSFTALYFGTLAILPNVIDLNKYKSQVSQAIEEQSGFKVSCEDISLKRTLTPYLKIHMYHTLVLYPDNEVFLKLKESELKVKLLPLLFKKILIKDAVLTRPIINITLNEDFSTSLDKYFDASKNISTNGFEINAIVQDTLCERYKLKIFDKTTGKLFHLEGDELLFKDFKLNDKINFVLKGALYEGEKEYLKYDLDIISSLQNKQQVDFSPFEAIYNSDIKGDIKGKIVVDKNKNINGYLKVDNVSLKVDDLLLSNNSIDVSFKGQEAQINSLLHTSKTDVAKVNGKISYGKKKTIDLTTQARNVNLTNLFKVISLITKTLNITNKYEDVKVTGLLDADFSLWSDFKKLKSTGSASVINASIKHNTLPYDISNINAVVDFANNKINIQKAQANINYTPVNLSGCINEDVSVELKATSNDLDLKNIISLFKIKLPIDVKNGKLSFVSDITGSLNKELNAKVNLGLSNLSIIDSKYKIPVNIASAKVDLSTNGKTYLGNVVCSDLSSKLDKIPLMAKTLKINFDDKKITIPDNIVNVLSSDVKVKGVVTNSEVKIDFNGDILSSEISKIVDKYINQPHKAQGVIKTNGKIFVQDEVLDLKLQMFSDEKNYISYAVIKELLNKPALLNIDCLVNGDNVEVKEISLSENLAEHKKMILLNGNLKLGKEILINNLKVNIPNFVSLNTNFFGGEELSFSADLIVNNTFSNPKLKGTAKVGVYNIKKYLTAIKNADLTFADNNIKVVAPDVQINNSKLNLVAEVNPKIEDKLSISNLQLYCENLDMNSLFDLIQKEANPFAQSLIEVKKGIATISRFSILDLKARDISTDLSIEENILKLKNISASAYGGQLSGDVDYDMPHSSLTLMLEGKHFNLKESLYDLCKLDDNIMGLVDFKTNISMITGEYDKALYSLDGDLDFNSTNGKMGTLGKFEYYLYAQNIMYHGFLKTTLNRIAEFITKDNTAQYRNSSGSLSFKNGYMNIKEIKTIGDVMSLYVKGRQNLISNQVNIDIYGRISDEITNKLGSFGNVSISDLLENKSTKTVNNLIIVPSSLINEIPLLYNKNIENTKTFKVNLLGDINSLSAINSFMWILPRNEEEKDLPDFVDIIKTTI